MGMGLLLDTSAAVNFFHADSDASAEVEKHQTDLLLETAMLKLPEREKLVISLHYYQHMPFVDIAALLGVTKGRVSQIHKAAIQRSREILRDEDRPQIIV